MLTARITQLVIALAPLLFADWVVTSEHPQFPKSQYWTGVGVAMNQSRARELASSEIAKQFQLNISSSNRDTQVEVQVGQQQEHSEFYYSKVQTSSSIELPLVEYVMSQEVPEGVAVLAVINKAKYTQHYHNSLNRILQEIAQHQQHLLKANELKPVWTYYRVVEHLRHQYNQSLDRLSMAGVSIIPFQSQMGTILESIEVEQHVQGIFKKYEIQALLSQETDDLKVLASEEMQGTPILIQCLGVSGSVLAVHTLIIDPTKSHSLKPYCMGASQVQVGHSGSSLQREARQWREANRVLWQAPTTWREFSNLSLVNPSEVKLDSGHLRSALQSQGFKFSTQGLPLEVRLQVDERALKSFQGIQKLTLYRIEFLVLGSENFKGFEIQGRTQKPVTAKFIAELISQKL